MSKQSRAAKLIEFADKRGYNSGLTAVLLNRFDLLAPDLPEPDMTSANGTPVWRSDRCLTTTVVRESNPVRMWIPDVGEIAYSPEDARQQAHMLLVAANHAEQAEQ